VHRLIEQPAGGDQVEQFAVGLFAGDLATKLCGEKVKNPGMVDNMAGTTPKFISVRRLDFLLLGTLSC